ncbi:Ti-type conjugative transfer relaxase TraA (plasmid) [Neorhizobium sp. DAR64861/K0K2]|uniref:Ti-type conjugative transfer relaxase TraA n=1 Tax=Neorhizobium sp. DAR64861/K0K2 TaxID=3421956 RepID=UPI003D27E120
MAIFYCQMSVVSRSTGRSAVASAAYRAAVTLTNERDGLVHDYSRREGVGHSEIILPDGVDAEWARDRSALWNAAERFENRKDARVAREFVVALPHELSEEGRTSLTREFAQDLANRYGAAVDFAIHAPGAQGDVRNHHAHVLMTTRQVTGEGLGRKTYMELANKDLLPKGLAPTQMQLVDIRRSWEGMANEHLAREGFDIRIDHRSHAERGLEIEPTEHMGVRATNVHRRGGQVDRSRLDDDARRRNADLIREKPEQVLAIITSEKSVFDRHDIARTLHRYINDDAQTFQNAFASVMASSALTELRPERVDEQTGEVELAKYSTKEMVDIEHGMADAAERMHQARGHHVDRQHVAKAMDDMDEAMRLQTGNPDRRLSDEQRRAIEHVTGPERIAAVVGLAGAGKSTMLAAAAHAWERQGYTVHGAALSGKAAEGLEDSSGIKSRTLASWSRGWENDKQHLGRGDVFVIDEAGMVGSRQLASFVGEAEKRGAKIVLVGDHEQLQAIGAGAPFRAIAQQIGHASLGEIKRQMEPWQQEASVAFASHRTAEGLAAYQDHGNIHFSDGRDAVRAAVVRDYLADREQHPDASRVAMAHRRVDVRGINEGIRSELQERGELGKGEEGGEFTFQTNDGLRSFAAGDRLVFLENNRDLGVKNGMLGKVLAVEHDAIQVELDGKGGNPGGIGAGSGSVTIDATSYQSFDHGYATTIHKNQGATVDRAFVLASGTMDRHLTYVAMSRHRHDVQLYGDAQEFASRRGSQMTAQGKLVEHGAAPYEHKAGNRESYFVTLEDAKGERHTTWGVGLQRAIGEAAPQIGSTIGLAHAGAEAVRLPGGQDARRNSWKVLGTNELAYVQLEDRLSRSGVKETTLDYAQEFAERRGLAEQLGISSEIRLDVAQGLDQEGGARAVDPARVVQDRSSHERSANAELTPSLADPGRTGADERAGSLGSGVGEGAQKSASAKRSMFEGLKLRASSGPAQGRSQAFEQAQPEKERHTPSVSEQERFADRLRPMSGFEQAVDHYARALSAAEKQVDQGLPLLDVHKQELNKAGERLDQVRPGSHALMRSSLQHDPASADAMTEMSGRERVGQLIAGMDRERAALADPEVRTERFIQRWQELQSERQERWHDDEARGKVEGQMRGMAKGLERDPQVETALRNRAPELGISHAGKDHNIAREMEQQIGQGHSQSRGIER